MRRIASTITGEPAPCALSLPTSSWSKRATSEISSSSSRRPLSEWATRLSIDTKQVAKLSNLAEYKNSFLIPPSAAGCVSNRLSSKSAISFTSTPNSDAIVSRSRGSCACFHGSDSLSFPSTVVPSSCAFTPSSSSVCVPRMGLRCSSLLTEKAFLSAAVWRWIHSVETRATGLSILTNLCTTFSFPSSPSLRRRTRPEMPRSRSNQVCQRPPP
mmetsp:Transcript_10799/g.20585  ORF Transcript_10799/g.20585 Transcript_10799/m.20585 type:complete len:214 (+) Transcript_10799:543-1184(+)